MKPMNFPGRKWFRRMEALERMEAKGGTGNTHAIQNTKVKLDGTSWERECGVQSKKYRGGGN